MLNPARILTSIAIILTVGCATGPSGMTFDSPVGEWSDSYEKRDGRYGKTRITIVDQAHAIYTYPNSGRIKFYAIDDQRIWKGYWILDNGSSACPHEKDGSPFWGETVFQFNETYNQYQGSWDVCGQGPKYATTGVR